MLDGGQGRFGHRPSGTKGQNQVSGSIYGICYGVPDSPVSHGFPLKTVILISEGEKDKCDTEEDYCQEVKGMEAAWAEKEGDISDVE